MTTKNCPEGVPRSPSSLTDDQTHQIFRAEGLKMQHRQVTASMRSDSISVKDVAIRNQKFP